MASETAMLLMVDGPTPGKRIFMDHPVMLMGRDERCDLQIDDRQVSRHHASITVEGDQYVLRDLNSKNGTFLNGQELDGPRALQDGDEIQIAYCCKLTFVGADATAPVLLDEAGVSGLRLDVESKRVWVAGDELDPPLSLAQYRLLALLYDEPGRVFSRDQVVEAVWPEDDREGISEQAIDALARRLRERLAETDPDTQYVVTVRGHGFRLENAIKET